MAGRTAVALICDRDFLVPTLGTALSARAQISEPDVEVFVYLTGERHDAADAERVERLRDVAQASDITVRYEPLAGLTDIAADRYNQTHVPVTTMARLWLGELLPSHVERFLYLDGDLDIANRLDQLLALEVPEKGLLAAPDLPMLIVRDTGAAARATRAYTRALGLTAGDQYFNCGVMLIDRGGWQELAAEAWAYFKADPERCRYHDQSALNAVAGDRRGVLSLFWNYQTDFMAVADPRDAGITPGVWHFTQSPKPWQASAFPWEGAFGRSYAAGCDLYGAAGLAPSETVEPSKFAARVNQRQRLKQRLAWVYPWRRVLRARQIRAHLEKTQEQWAATARKRTCPHAGTAAVADIGGTARRSDVEATTESGEVAGERRSA